jgi:hypothetical protein
MNKDSREHRNVPAELNLSPATYTDYSTDTSGSKYDSTVSTCENLEVPVSIRTHWPFKIRARFQIQNSLKLEHVITVRELCRYCYDFESATEHSEQSKIRPRNPTDRITQNQYLKFPCTHSNRSFCLPVLSNKYWITSELRSIYRHVSTSLQC